MDEYISRNELLKDVQSNVAEAHNERCAQLLEAILNAPTADVVPKSEVEKLEQDVARLVQEKDDLIKNYAECMKDYAREIFEETEKIRLNEIKRCEVMREKEYTHAQRNYWEGGEHSLRQLSYWIAELKNKYTESENG